MVMAFVRNMIKSVRMAIRKGRTSDDSEPFPIEDLPEEIQIIVLSHVGVADLKNCCLLSKRWLNLVNSQALWKAKCTISEKIVPPLIWDDIPDHYYRTIYLKNPYGRNLIKNPSGEEGLSYWQIIENGGDHWKVENPPAGADEIPDTDIQYCFATSYGTCKKTQTINLLAEGVHSYVLDNIRPDIEVSEWHASRFDCGTTYKLTVALRNAKDGVLDSFQFGPYNEDQWTGRAWSQVRHVFSEYPPGVRYVTYTHSGRDTQFWAGHYGCKIAHSSVRIIFKKSTETI